MRALRRHVRVTLSYRDAMLLGTTLPVLGDAPFDESGEGRSRRQSKHWANVLLVSNLS